MAEYYPISQEEMESFLFPQGFKLVTVEGCKELVYAKAIRLSNMLYSLRVYSSLVAGAAREVGADAIRVQAVWRKASDSPIVLVGGSKRVHRVKGWKANLQSRLDDWAQSLGPQCPACGSPTRLRQPKANQKWKAFHGCCCYPACKGSLPADD